MTKQIQYNKLWKLFVDKKLGKVGLRRGIGAAPNTLIKQRRTDEVPMSNLIRICDDLNCDIGDIVPLGAVSHS